MKIFVLSLALLVVPTAGLFAQAPCSTCDGTGVLPCRMCPAVEADVLNCSVAADCRSCRGALATLCANCTETTAGAAELKRRHGMAREFLADRRALLADHGVGERGVLQCRTERFDLLFAPGRIEGCPESDPHLQMHLYAARLEALRQEIEAQLGVGAFDFASTPIQLAVVRDEPDHRRLSNGLTGLEVQGLGRMRLDGQPSGVLLQTPEQDSDGALHRLFVHAGTHLLLASLMGRSLDEAGHGWFDAGLAHWFEGKTGSLENFCVLATPQPPRMFWGGDWKVGVRELLEDGMLPSVTDVLATGTSDLDFAQHALAFALVDYLLVQLPVPITHDAGPTGPPPVRDLLRAVEAGVPADTALTQVLGRDLEAIEVALHSFVREGYPRK